VYGQDIHKNFRIEISQHNIMTGSSSIYVVKSKKIKRLIRHSENIMIPKLMPTYLSNQDMDSINLYLVDLIENLNNGDRYADNTVLDGWDWNVIINNGTKGYNYTFSNCSCSYVDKLINYLNLKLDKKALIYPTDYMHPEKCCNN
jgi:hypothetical protein